MTYHMSVIIDKYGDVKYKTQNLNDKNNRKTVRGTCTHSLQQTYGGQHTALTSRLT